MAQLAAARNPVLDAATKFVLGIDICSEAHNRLPHRLFSGPVRQLRR